MNLQENSDKIINLSQCMLLHC